VLVVNHRNDGKKDDEQCREGQGLLEGVAELVLLDDAVEGREQHDDHQADQTHRRPVHGQAHNQDNSHQGLYR
jgi:hypothetical protein